MTHHETAHYDWRATRPTHSEDDPSRKLVPLSDEAFAELAGLSADEAQALLAGPENTKLASAIVETLSVQHAGKNRIFAVLVQLCARVRELEDEVAMMRGRIR